MFSGMNWTTVLIVVLVVLVYGIDKWVTWRLTQKGIEAAEKQVPIEGIGKLFEGFAKLPGVHVGYQTVLGELKEVAAGTDNPWDDKALEWFDEKTGKRWFREDRPPEVGTFKRVEDADRTGEPPGAYSSGS